MAAQALVGTIAAHATTAPSLSAYASRSLQDRMFSKLKETYPALANAGLLDYLYANLQAAPTQETSLGSYEFYSGAGDDWNTEANEYWAAQ